MVASSLSRLNGRAYAESIWDVRRAVKVSGTAGVTVSTSRVSDTEVTVKLDSMAT